MFALRWECDICEEPRYSSQMLRCNACGNYYIGYCCLDDHNRKLHADYDPEKHDGLPLNDKVNHMEELDKLRSNNRQRQVKK